MGLGAEIGTYGRGGAINPPNRSENDDRGGDLRRSASFRLPKPERANRDKFQKPSGMVCSRLPNTIFSADLAFQPGLVWWKICEGDELIGQEWSGWSGKVSQGWGWKQISLISLDSLFEVRVFKESTKPKVCSSKRPPPKSEPRSVRPNQVFENLWMWNLPNDREWVKIEVFEKTVFE